MANYAVQALTLYDDTDSEAEYEEEEAAWVASIMGCAGPGQALSPMPGPGPGQTGQQADTGSDGWGQVEHLGSTQSPALPQPLAAAEGTQQQQQLEQQRQPHARAVAESATVADVKPTTINSSSSLPGSVGGGAQGRHTPRVPKASPGDGPAPPGAATPGLRDRARQLWAAARVAVRRGRVRRLLHSSIRYR
jgi:hypothetical protein